MNNWNLVFIAALFFLTGAFLEHQYMQEKIDKILAEQETIECGDENP